MLAHRAEQSSLLQPRLHTAQMKFRMELPKLKKIIYVGYLTGKEAQIKPCFPKMTYTNENLF